MLVARFNIFTGWQIFLRSLNRDTEKKNQMSPMHKETELCALKNNLRKQNCIMQDYINFDIRGVRCKNGTCTELVNLLKLKCYFTCYEVQHSKILHPGYIAFVNVLRVSDHTVTSALYIINRLGFITELECVYRAVRSESLCNTDTFRT